MKPLPTIQAVAAGFLLAAACIAEVPRVLPKGAEPDDHRLGPLRHLDNYFPFSPVESREAGSRRADALRRRVKVACGLWPISMPRGRSRPSWPPPESANCRAIQPRP